MAYATRRSYAGAAPSCTLTNTISSGDTTISLTGDVTNWNTTSNGPFYVVIDPGLATEEKISVASRTSTVLSSVTRGVDGTVAAAHTAGAICYPVFTAIDADQANAVASALSTKGDLLVTTGSVLNRLPVGTNAYTLLADSTATNGVVWGQVSNVGVAAGAAIAYSKLNLATSIVNADVSTTAAIALSKLATTGTVTATTFVGALTGNVTGTASNASKIDNHTVSVGNSQPTSPALNDIWFQTA